MFPVRKRRSSKAATTQRRNRKRKISDGKLKALIKRSRTEIVEIDEEQKSIKAEQTLVRNKFEELKEEREKLKMETKLISQQNLSIQHRLILIFQIFKAKLNNDFAKAAQLTQSLRDLIANQNVRKGGV